MFYFDENDEAKDFVRTCANYEEILKQLQLYEAALESNKNDLINSVNYLYSLSLNEASKFLKYQEKFLLAPPRKISMEDRLNEKHFHEFMQSLTIKTDLICALNQFKATLDATDQADYLRTTMKAAGINCYKAAMDVAQQGLVKQTPATDDDMKLLTSVIKRSEDLYRDPFDAVNHNQFNSAVAEIPAKRWEFNWNYFIKTVANYTMLALCALMFTQMILAPSLTNFVVDLLSMITVSTLGNSVSDHVSEYDRASIRFFNLPKQFFHPQNTELTSSLNKFKNSSKEVCATANQPVRLLRA